MALAQADTLVNTMAQAFAPRVSLSVSAWADQERVLSSKESAEPGRWRTARNPVLREPMDCWSARSTVREMVLRFPIQIGKTMIAVNALGYSMEHRPGPIMVCLPGEVAMDKWVEQKLNPMIEETPAVAATLTTLGSRDSANTRTFKDFAGGQLYLEHAGAPQRLKTSSVRDLIADELDDFADNLTVGDDPLDLLEGRTSAFPATSRHLYIGTPGIAGLSRIMAKWEESDQRRYYIRCPDCGHEQPLEWSGLHWSPDASEAWYACRECGVVIDEHQKTKLLADGRWVAEKSENTERCRGYALNCLYYAIGLGPSWAKLARMWLAAQSKPAKLKTFVNDRLAEAWEDPAMRSVKDNVVRDRAEPYRLRLAPAAVLALTAGVDTQDNRLAVQIVGWARNLAATTLDYVELPGDPENPEVWVALTELLNKPIERVGGALMRVEAVALDAGGHRTEAVYNYVRQRLVRRIMAIFGAVPNNAPVLSRGKLVDINWKGRLDKRGITVHHVGTVGIKHELYARLSADSDKPMDARHAHFSDELPDEFFTGLVSEKYDPRKNRFVKIVTRNEPLDTWVYAYAATHHPELRLHRRSKADWDQVEARLAARVEPAPAPAPGAVAAPGVATPPPRKRTGLGGEDWQL